MKDDIDFAACMPIVARALLGEPNKALSSRHEWRYGKNGSLSINLKTGTFFDHELNEGGGVMRLIELRKGLEGADAIQYMRDIGCPITANGSVREEITYNAAADPFIGVTFKNARKDGNGQFHITRTWQYTDENNTELFEVCRLENGEGKKYKQRHKGVDGEYIDGVKGIRQVPYRLPDLIDAVAENKTIFIVEGEKCADAIVSLGGAATCNAMGAGKWPDELTHFFKDADVCILPDNDKPGADHAAKVFGKAQAVARRVRVLELPGLAPKGDVADWVEAGGTLDQLQELTETARSNPSEAKLDFPLTPWKDIAFDIEEEWRVEGVFPLVGLACLYGGPGSVKTFILLDLYARMARGGFWARREVKQCPVVYAAAEGGNGIKKRIAGLKKVAAEKGLLADIPFHLITVAPNLGTGDGDCKKLIADIEATGAKPGAIAIDTTTQALGGADENGEGMDQLVVNATAIANHFQCLVVLVHHTPVADDDRLRGKSSLLGGLDVSIISKREKGSFVATLTIKKMRDEDETQSFTVNLARVVLGTTKKGREVSTLVVETVEPGTAEFQKAGRKLPDSAVNALSALRYAIDEVGVIPPASNHIPNLGIGIKCVSPKQWREYANMTSTLPEGGQKGQEF